LQFLSSGMSIEVLARTTGINLGYFYCKDLNWLCLYSRGSCKNYLYVMGFAFFMLQNIK
jgi:hypothetical protein